MVASPIRPVVERTSLRLQEFDFRRPNLHRKVEIRQILSRYLRQAYCTVLYFRIFEHEFV